MLYYCAECNQHFTRNTLNKINSGGSILLTCKQCAACLDEEEDPHSGYDDHHD